MCLLHVRSIFCINEVEYLKEIEYLKEVEYTKEIEYIKEIVYKRSRFKKVECVNEEKGIIQLLSKSIGLYVTRL